MTFDFRERAHELLRSEMANAAVELILQRGYANLTVEDLAQHVGVSRPTFYRHFGSKDEIILQVMLGNAAEFGNAYRTSPRLPGASRWQQILVAFEPAALLAETSPERQREMLRLVQSLPAVGARLRRDRAPQIENLADALLDDGCEDFTARVLASAAVAVLDQCWVHWMRDEHASLRVILNQAFKELETAAISPSVHLA